MRESSLTSVDLPAGAANDAQCLTLIDGQVNAVQRHKRLAEQPLVGADDGVRVLLAAHTGHQLCRSWVGVPRRSGRACIAFYLTSVTGVFHLQT